MTQTLDALSPRSRSWNTAMMASPGTLSVTVPAADVVGTVPPALRGGRVWSNGPGWSRFGDHIVHPFDGHGYLRRYALLADGAVQLDARFIETAVYADESRAQKFVHRGFATNVPGSLWANVGLRGAPRNVANTTVYPWGGRILAGWEGGSPYAVDPDTLDTIGPHTFDGLIDGEATLAHIHRDGRTGHRILCSITSGRSTGVTFRELDADGAHVQTRSGRLPGLAFAHDFAFTPQWYILGGNPLSVKPLSMAGTVLGLSTLLRAVRADLGRPGELVLIPRTGTGTGTGTGEPRRIRLPEPAFVVHFANAFSEDDGTTVVDACVFHRFDFGEEFGYTGPRSLFDPSLPEARGPQRLYRITIPPDADTATWAPLVPHGVDFPRVHPDLEGQRAPVMVGATRADTRYSDPFDSIIRVDLDNPGEPVLWTAPEATFVGEPLLLPGDSDGDYIAAILSDGLRERTTLAIFREDALADGPVARASLPLMPIAFHGDWQPPGPISP